MLVQEIKEKLSTPEIIDLSTLITIKPYLSHVEKKILCENIINASLEQNENGLFVCDYYNRELTKNISIIVNYTDININNEEFLEDYDYLCEQGIIDYVLNSMNKNDRFFIKSMVSKNINQKISIENSIESVLAKNLQSLTSKIPDEKSIKKLINDIPKSINKIKPDNMAILKDLFKQGDKNG
jgi:hypothetical protein